MYACTLYFLFKTSPHQFFLSQSASTSVQTAQLFHQSCRPLVATAEVPERCKVQRSSVWRRLGDPSHVSLLMLSQGEVVTRPTGVTVPPPNWLSHGENGAETWIFWSPFHQLSFVSAVWWGFSQQIKPTVDKEAMSVSYFGYSNINSTLWFIYMMSFCLIWLCAVYLIFHAVNISPLFFDQIFSFNLYVLSHVP